MTSESTPGAEEIRSAIRSAGYNWSVSADLPGQYPAPRDKRRKPFRPRQSRRTAPLAESLFAAAAPSVDWRAKTTLSPPLEQGAYNTCSAFTITGLLADLVEIAQPGTTLRLSAGHLHACIGGLPPAVGVSPSTLANAARTVPIAAASAGDYPYPPARCPAAVGVRRVRDIRTIADAAEARAALAVGPVLAVMDLHDDFWPFYGGGVYRPVAAWRTSHSIAVVGYDDSGGYWIVRNTHGPTWGEGGYGKIAYEVCGMFGFYRGLQLFI